MTGHLTETRATPANRFECRNDAGWALAVAGPKIQGGRADYEFATRAEAVAWCAANDVTLA